MKNFEKFKKDIIKDKIKNKNNSNYSNAFAFAIKNDIFPICDLFFGALWEYESDFKITKQVVSDIYIDLQNHYDSKKEKSFSDISLNSGTWGKTQMDKVDILRYFYLSSKFQNAYQDYNFWEKLFENESYDENFYSPITRTFTINELTDYIEL